MAETFIFDYSFGRPDPTGMSNVGANGVARYLAPLPNAKVLSRAEMDRLLAVGLSITVIWETVNQRALKSGYAGGQNDAHEAIAMAQSLGVPEGAGLYYCLEDPTKLPRSDWPTVIDYARGVYDVGGPYRRGGYGSQALLEEVIHMGFITLGWQVEGWSKGVSPVCHLFQRSNSRQHPFPETDENVCLQADWGQWPLVDQPAPPHQEDDMPGKTVTFPDVDTNEGGPRNRGLVAAYPSCGGRPYWVPSTIELNTQRFLKVLEPQHASTINDRDQQKAILAAIEWSR